MTLMLHAGATPVTYDALRAVVTPEATDIRRKHTVKAKRELPGLVTDIVRPLQGQRIAQNQKLLAYQGHMLTDEAADHAILDLYRQDVIGVQAIGKVLDAYFRAMPQYTPKGISDIIVVHVGRPYFLEVKRPGSYQSAEQKDFQKNAERAGALYAVVRSIEDAIALGL
jgi:hypothetical protein